jgi:diguanylate cyclase (GGDEF)-like protein
MTVAKKTYNPHIYVVFLAAMLSLSVIFFVSYRLENRLVVLDRWTLHTNDVLGTLERISGAILEAETSSRGYILTGNQSRKLQYQVYVDRIQDLLASLKKLTSDNPLQQERLEKVGGLITGKVDNLGSSMTAMETEGFQIEQQSRMTEEGALLMSMLRTNIKEIANEEQSLLVKRRGVGQETLDLLVYLQWAGAIVTVAMLSLMLLFARRETATRKKAAAVIDAESIDLEAANKNITDLSTMTELLQSSSSLIEAGDILASYGGKLFAGDFGGIYVLNHSRDLLEPLALWGACPNEPFTPDACWSLRRGQPHLVKSQQDVKCKHATDGAECYICVPMAAQHETLGVLHLGLTSKSAVAAMDKTRAKASSMAAQVALALRNLQLRQQLREMSIRDTLTGLLNRRYLEESLLKELSRAHRKDLPLSVVMIDIDHFKTFNDTFGHQAGDTVLKELGQLFQKHVREGDFACRLGGEEFTLILPELTKEAAFRRADKIRLEIKKLQLVSGAQSLGIITISAGVAAFPADGETSELLMAAADSALYSAKKMGRNRVEIYATPEVSETRTEA